MAGLGDLNMANPVFITYLFYAAILGLKTLLMSLFTARHRIGNKVRSERVCASFVCFVEVWHCELGSVYV